MTILWLKMINSDGCEYEAYPSARVYTSLFALDWPEIWLASDAEPLLKCGRLVSLKKSRTFLIQEACQSPAALAISSFGQGHDRVIYCLHIWGGFLFLLTSFCMGSSHLYSNTISKISFIMKGFMSSGEKLCICNKIYRTGTKIVAELEY